MNNEDWIEEFPGMISVCDTEGKILVMNKKIADYFTSSGGKELVGTSLFDCHGPASGAQVRQLLANKKLDVYVAEENGTLELAIHAPWYKDGIFAGLVEITVPLENEIRVVKRP
jgi:transcriptional regulator with PAS, ATPase and Fis domain